MSETELWLSIGNIIRPDQDFAYPSLGNVFLAEYPTENMGLWLLESDAGNQDWIGSEDPETVILDNFTSGIDLWQALYVKIEGIKWHCWG